MNHTHLNNESGLGLQLGFFFQHQIYLCITCCIEYDNSLYYDSELYYRPYYNSEYVFFDVEGEKI